MKKICFRTAVFVFLSMIFSTAQVGAVSDTIDATATIQAGSLTVTGITDLNFGTITLSGGANTVTLDASAGAATPSVTAGTAMVAGGGSGLVEVVTSVDATVTIAYSIVGGNAGAADTMDIVAGDTIAVSNISANSTTSPLAITVAGSPNDIHVGGELTILAGQAVGTYTGTLTVDVNY